MPQSDLRKRFLFVGGDPSLDLVNTLTRHYNNTLKRHLTVDSLELLDSPERLLDWYEAIGLTAPSARANLLGRGPALLDSVRALRGHLNRLFRAWISNAPASSSEPAIGAIRDLRM
jgi:hypothetical protein